MRIVIYCLLALTLMLAGCSSYERDNRFDAKGVAYDPSPEVEQKEINTGVKSLYTHSGLSCDLSCASFLGFLVLFVFLTMLATIDLADTLVTAVFLKPAAIQHKPVAAYSFDLPSLPDYNLPNIDLPDFSTDPSAYYSKLKSVTPSAALKSLGMSDIDPEQYHIDDVTTLAQNLDSLKKVLKGKDLSDFRTIGDSLQNTLFNSAAATLQSTDFQNLLARHLDSLDIPADSLVSFINSDTCALTDYLWDQRSGSFQDSVKGMLIVNLNKGKAPMLFIAMRGMYVDLYKAILPQKAGLVGNFLKEYALPDTAIAYQDVAEEFAQNSLKQLRTQMSTMEIQAKEQSEKTPDDVRKFFATYRGRYGN